MDVSVLARGDLRDMEAYRPVTSDAPVRLDANESPWGLSEDLRKKLAAWLESGENLNRYPDSDNAELRAAIARFWGVGPANVTCGVGSDQLIDMLCAAFLEPGDRIVTQRPTFGMYAVAARLRHGAALAVPAGVAMSDAEALVRTAERERAKIIFLCRPNNPTGDGMPEECVRFLLENAPCVVALDEAYAEFAGESLVDWTRRCPNLAVLRTFSKAYGLAGARVGYVVADERLIGLLDLVKPPFNISTISQKLAVWALEASGEYEARTAGLVDARERLRESLEALDWLDIERSDANFLYARSERDVAAILSGGGVSVRSFAKSGGLYCVRVSVGSDEENKKVSDLLWAANQK